MATQLATRTDNPIAVLSTQLEQRAIEFRKVLPAHITPEKLQRTILTAVQGNPALLEASRQSFIMAAMKCAQDGLLPDGREAALVEFKTSVKEGSNWVQKRLVQFMPMVYGLRKKILQSGEISAIEVGIVYAAEVAKGTFLYEVGLEPPLRHRPSLDLTAEETTDDQIVAAYSIATMKDGTRSFELMRRFEIDRVREASQTGATKDRKGQTRQPKGPWVDWFPEMAKKTVMRRHAKTLPMSGDILDVEARDEAAYATSAVSVLGSAREEEPMAITGPDEQGQGHDPETGEITDQDDDFTPHPASAVADQIITDTRAAQTVIDLQNLEKARELDIAAMPDEMAEPVRGAFETARVRLGGGK